MEVRFICHFLLKVVELNKGDPIPLCYHPNSSDKNVVLLFVSA